MTTESLSSVNVEAFKALFPCYSQAHGIFKIRRLDPQTGKKKGTAETVCCGAPIQAWEKHLAGGPRGLGAIPLLDDGESVKWAAIDIDDHSIDLTELEKLVQSLS